MSEEYLVQLIQKYAAGKASTEEVQELFNWYQSASPGEVTWPGDRDEVYSRMLQRLRKEKSPAKGRVVSFRWIKVAAVFLIVAGVGYLALRFAKTSGEIITVTNPTGKIQAVHLPDGSAVWLNAASELRYAKNFTHHRDIQLKGEAYFEVVHNTAYPFTVTVDEMQTKVLGTSFNIKAYPEDETATVSLVTGKVEVSEQSKRLAILQPSTQLLFNRQTHASHTLPSDTNAVLAWKKGILKFEGESFSNIANTLERWYGVQFHFANPDITNCRYYLSAASSTTINKMLQTLRQLTGMEYTYDADKKIINVSGKGCPGIQ